MISVSGKTTVSVWRVFREKKKLEHWQFLAALGKLGKCFVVFGHLRQLFDTVGSLRKSFEIIGNCWKIAENSLKYQTKYYWLFWSRFVSLWQKTTVTVNFLLLVLKCLKFNFFMLRIQSQKIINKCLALSRYPPFRPLIFWNSSMSVTLSGLVKMC